MSIKKQTIDFSTPNPMATENFSLPLYKGCNFSPVYNAWYIKWVRGFFKFKITLPEKQNVLLQFELCSAINDHGVSNCPINISVNGNSLIDAFDPHIYNFYEKKWSIPEEMLNVGENEVILSLSGGSSTIVFMKSATIEFGHPKNESNWLSRISDNKKIIKINLPGTHDSAAINTSIHTPYACHYKAIKEQLEGGVRLLDVRLKVTKKDDKFEFITCHGDIGSKVHLNEYQSFPSLLDECKDFLLSYNSEMVAMILKIDDWNGYHSDREVVLKSLKKLLDEYPCEFSANKDTTIGGVRGRIVVYNRIPGSNFSTYLEWKDNTEGGYMCPSYLYVQDKYSGLSAFGYEREKFNLVKDAFLKEHDMLLNFASATHFYVIGVYIMGDLLSFFGERTASERPDDLGWTLFDYEFSQYKTDKYGYLDVVRLIIASNFNYEGFEDKFNLE